MNPVILQIVKWILEKALIEAGKKADWQAIKAEVDDKLDSMIPSSIYDTISKYLVNKLLDVISGYFNNSAVPVTPDVIHQMVERASQTLLGKVTAELLKV